MVLKGLLKGVRFLKGKPKTPQKLYIHPVK